MSRILVADDDVDQLAMQRALLGEFGYEVDIAASADDTMRAMQRAVPDLVIVDLRFPRTADGLALIRKVREANSLVPLIVVSGWPDDLYGTPEEALVTRVLVKGTIRDLLGTIAELLAG